jgi:biopolymer transport protein ExbD
MGVSFSNNKGFVSEINVTPFVDVMLVLLIIFMVTAPMLTQGLDVDLPATSTVDVLPTDSENMVLTIRKDGSMFLDEYQVTPARSSGQAGQKPQQAAFSAGRQRRGLWRGGSGDGHCKRRGH